MGLTAPNLRRRGRSSSSLLSSSETAFSSNLKGCFMATLMMVMFLFVSHIGTSPNNNNNNKNKSTALRKDGKQPQQQQSLRNFDPDQIGVIHLSASENDDGIDAKESNKHNDNNNKIQQQGGGQEEGYDDDDDDTDDDDTHFFWDIDEFERDADLLDTKSRFDDFVDHLQSAMDEQLVSLQSDIDGRIQTTMEPTKTELEDINKNRVDTNVRFHDDDFQKLVTNIENKFREKLYNEIHSQSNEVMEDLIIDMEAAMDLNQEYEEEDGDGEPIDLDAEEEDLMVQAVTAVDEIVQDVLTNTNMAQMVFEVMYGQLQQLFKETFGQQRKIVIDINKKEWKVNGWHENLPPTLPPTTEPTPKPEEQKKKDDDDDDDEDNRKEDSNKEPENKNETTNDNNDRTKTEESEKKNEDDVKETKTKEQGESTTPQEPSKDVEQQQQQPKQDEEQKEEVDTDSKPEEEKTSTVDKKEDDKDEDTTEGK
ncbi:hypothetical protein IV203_025669 [Nitzschia inconspicua]|uniref:Uncharacterized protein n=1 Tax=Nitzschia inconspicua TaxID=303405 RepID=A0A9K3LHA5_9STRA|nr:hypothetical protein IV203_025669 [Nitzschia inconspicua]